MLRTFKHHKLSAKETENIRGGRVEIDWEACYEADGEKINGLCVYVG